MLGPGGDDARSNSLPAQRLEMDSTRDNSAYSTLHPLYMVNFLIVKSSPIQSGPMQTSPFQSSPTQYSPVQSSTFQSSPI